jgi:hypothetical protein
MVHAVTFTLLFLAGTVQAQDVHLLFYSDCTSSVNKQNIGSTETLQSLSARELESIAQTARKSKGTRVSVVQFGTTSRILFRDRVNRRSTPVLQRVYGQLQVPCAVPNTDIVQALNHIVQLIQSRPQDQYLVLLFSDGFHTKSSQNDFYEALAGFAQAMQRYRVRSVGMIGVDGTEIVEIERRLKANIIGSVPSTVVVPIENLATGTKEILAFAK